MTESPMTSAPPAAPPPASVAAPPAPERLNLAYHVIIGVAMGIVAPFTVLAWPFAVLTGMVIGAAEADRMLGRAQRGGLLRVLAVTGGVLAMLFFGAILGGLISFLIVALAAFSERVAARTTSTDQGIARILIFILTVAIWFTALYVLKLNVNVSLG